MNWDVVSAISQTASEIAVVISLLYLAFQIRFARLAAAGTFYGQYRHGHTSSTSGTRGDR